MSKSSTKLNSNQLELAFVSDTSSLILLYKSSLLPELSSYCSFLISDSIEKELLAKSTRIEKQIYRNSTLIVQMDRANQNADQSLFEMYKQHDCYAILSDDGDVLRKCNNEGIPHYCALSLLPELASRNIIKYELAITKMRELVIRGRYSPIVIEIAYKMLKA